MALKLIQSENEQQTKQIQASHQSSNILFKLHKTPV